MMRKQEVNRRAITEWIYDGRRTSRFVVPGNKDLAHTPNEMAKLMLNATAVNVTDKVLILYTAEFLPMLATEGFADVTIATEVYDPFVAGIVKACNKLLVVNYKYMTIGEIEENDMKFDAVLANPPYVGKRELHQQFFNKAVEEMVVDGGTVCFIQPSTPYMNNKDGNKHQQRMRQNVREYKTNIRFVPSTVFEGAAVGNALAITMVQKAKSDTDAIDTVEFLDGEIRKDAKLEDINLNGMSLDVFVSIRAKVEAYIEKHGSLESIRYRNDHGKASGLCGLARVRGHMNCDDFYTILSKDDSRLCQSIDEEWDYGLKVKSESEIQSIYSYFRTYVCRAILSLKKCTPMNMGELKNLPLIPFDREWNDEMLCDLFGITEEEFAEILKVIPAYYD